jgi:hypothetical protein
MKPSFVAVLLCLSALTGFAAVPTADQLLTQAKVKAAAEHKALFVHFGASWCVWCQRLEAWLQRPEVRPAFEKYFIPVKIDVREKEPDKKLENEGGDKVLKQLGGEGAGIPFLAFVNADGHLIVNSIRPFGNLSQNIGYPGALAEIDWFMRMIRTAAPEIATDDLRSIQSSLEKATKQQ